MSKSLVDKMNKPGIPTAWITEVKRMLRHIAAAKVELETRIEIIDTLAKEREEFVKIIINTVNSIDRAWDSESLEYSTETITKIVRSLDSFLVRLDNNHG